MKIPRTRRPLPDATPGRGALRFAQPARSPQRSAASPPSAALLCSVAPRYIPALSIARFQSRRRLRLVFTSCLPRRLRARAAVLRLPTLDEGRRSAGAGHWHSCRACEARPPRPVASGTAPLGAPRGDFRPRDRRFVSRQCPPGSAPRLRPRPDSRPPDRAPHLPRPRFAPPPRDATPPPSPRNVSGDAPQ
jgi:hypothetical protein